MLCRYLQHEMQSQSIYIDRWRKRIHLLHDFKTLHNFDELNADIRADDWNVVRSKEISSAFGVDVIHQPRNCLPGLFVHEIGLVVFAGVIAFSRTTVPDRRQWRDGP